MLGGMLNAMQQGGAASKIVVVVLLLLFIAVGIYAYYQYNQSALDKKRANVANAPSSGGATGNGVAGTMNTFDNGTLDVMFFNVDWCPHCVKAKPDWQAFVQKYDQQVIQGYTVTCVGGSTGINCTNTDDPEVKEAVKRYNIQHYPTLIFVQNGTQVEFDAKINATNLDDFMNKL